MLRYQSFLTYATSGFLISLSLWHTFTTPLYSMPKMPKSTANMEPADGTPTVGAKPSGVSVEDAPSVSVAEESSEPVVVAVEVDVLSVEVLSEEEAELVELLEAVASLWED